MRTLAALAVAGLCLAAQMPAPPELPKGVELLSRIRQQMVWQLQHQPNYTCVETVERASRSGSTKKFQLKDTLRFEVALVEGKEMFAWPGSKNFEDQDLTTMVTSGAIGNGNFATHARAIFETRAAQIEYSGEFELDGRKSLRYDFSVEQMLSGYKIKVAAHEAVVGYHGSFYVEPQTLDVRRIDVIADDLPVELLMSRASDRIDYARARIGEADFLLPSASELTMVDVTGHESRNHVRFAGCRQFSGESVLTFTDPPPSPDPSAEPKAVREFDLPGGLNVELMLLDNIDTSTIAVGDPVHAELHSNVKQKRQIVLAKGATAIGRITRIERNEDYTLLGMEFSEIESPGVRARMHAKLDRIVGVEQSSPRGPVHLGFGLLPGEGIIPLKAGRIHLSRGCLLYWRT